MAQRLKTDWILFTTVVVLLLVGTVMLYSASSVMAQVRYQSTWHFVLRQFLWLVAGVCVMMLLKRTHYRNLQNPAIAFIAIGVVLILLVLVYILDARGHRWLRMGPIGLQPAELAKPALVIFLAFFVTLRAKAINDRHTLLPAALAIGLITLGVVIADLGTAVVMMATAATVFYVAGLEPKYFGTAVAIAILCVIGAVISKPYRIARIVGHIDPEYKLLDKIDSKGRVKDYLKAHTSSRNTSYQADQSKIAVGAGGPLGMGLMQGKQKLLYLPEAHNDFIFAVICEELGLAGAVGLVIAFLIIFWRGLRATFLMSDEFGRYLALGVTTMLVLQAFINMSVVLGMVPTKGITLPMISYGGSSLLSTLASLGILMNVSEHAG
jgi:cell division protein FtsW